MISISIPLVPPPALSEYIKVLYGLLFNGYLKQFNALINCFLDNFTITDDYNTLINNLFILSPEDCSKYIETNLNEEIEVIEKEKQKEKEKRAE
ncbi:hypothetical protein AGMMS50222_11150 [Endomicrobiia bacterium]|nr:hypothetical protein AGMMS50222_11150 [Endomicrobiia bacterium]